MPLMLALEGTEAVESVAITSEMLQPIVTALTNNLNVLLPVGITIMGIMIGVHLIPRIIYKFF